MTNAKSYYKALRLKGVAKSCGWDVLVGAATTNKDFGLTLTQTDSTQEFISVSFDSVEECLAYLAGFVQGVGDSVTPQHSVDRHPKVTRVR